jgi:hypothetical protein
MKTRKFNSTIERNSIHYLNVLDLRNYRCLIQLIGWAELSSVHRADNGYLGIRYLATPRILPKSKIDPSAKEA